MREVQGGTGLMEVQLPPLCPGCCPAPCFLSYSPHLQDDALQEGAAPQLLLCLRLYLQVQKEQNSRAATVCHRLTRWYRHSLLRCASSLCAIHPTSPLGMTDKSSFSSLCLSILFSKPFCLCFPLPCICLTSSHHQGSRTPTQNPVPLNHPSLCSYLSIFVQFRDTSIFAPLSLSLSLSLSG